MKMKRSLAILLALVSLLAMLAVPAAAGAAPEYQYTLPENYSDTKEYPTVYLLPDNGLASHSEALYDAIRANGTDVLIIRPTFTSGMDLHAQMAELVQTVDERFRTIADPAYRAIVGARTGGYLAYVLGMSDGTAFKTTPDLFTFVGSVDGAFGTEHGSVKSIIDNGLVAYEETKKQYDQVYGDIAQYFYPPNPLETYYTYMDAPVESQYTDMAGSTSELGKLYIDQGIGSDVHEFTLRPGSYTNSFVTESGKRIAQNFTKWMLSDIATGKVELEQSTLTASDSTATANYSVSVKAEIGTFAAGGVPMKVTVKVIDPETGRTLTSASETVEVRGDKTYTGSLTLENKVNGSFSRVELIVELLEAELNLDYTFLVRSFAPVLSGSRQKIDLMGDWYFKYTGATGKLDVPALTQSQEYRTWDIAQPGLENWTDGHGNISQETVGVAPDNPLFGLIILGNGYYVKEFNIPSGFNAQDVVLSIGNIDDRCEVFLNGKRVGATGMDENGETTNESTWAVYSYFTIDPADLNYGGSNTLVVRAFNDLSGGAGGWYSGPIGLYSREAFNAENNQDSARFYEETYYSAALGKDMEYLIYLPEGYENTERYYPTMYLLHQFNSDHTSYRVDKIDQLMDELIEDDRIDDMIVVIPNSSEMSFWRDSYERMVTDDLIPHIDENYRTVKDARYRLTAGCSMGGQGAMAVALRNPDEFSGAVSFFGAFDYGFDCDPRLIARMQSAEYLDNFAMYFICGNQDSYGFGTCNIDLHQALDAKGANHYFFIENGGHDSAFYLPNFQKGVEYVYGDMKQQGAAVKRLVAGELEAAYADGKVTLTPSFGVKDGFASYFNRIPASSYTGNQTPDVNIPLLITVKQDGKAKKIVLREHDLAPMQSASGVTLNKLDAIDVTDVVDPSKPFEVTYKAALFHHDPVLLKSVKVAPFVVEPIVDQPEAEVPDTGDNSSMLLWTLALVSSAAAVMMLKRRTA